MAATGVLVLAAVLFAAVFYWSGHFGGRRRGGGTSLRRGPGAHTTSRGQPKRGYVTREEAQGQAQLLTKRDGVPMSAYRCDTCGKWHVGH
jgi:hypothetical protein